MSSAWQGEVGAHDWTVWRSSQDGVPESGGHCREGTAGGEHLVSQQCPTMHWDACGVVHQYPSYLVKHQIVKDPV